MLVQRSLEQKLKNAFQPTWYQVLNESDMHNVPPNSESHFKVVIVSTAFDEKSRIQRHQMINAVVKDELKGPIHALSIQAHTVAEWEERSGSVLQSPDCIGE
ncbi:MAG: BolA/IbaG family iron-sulfur metabolism protein [Pseudomonadota bacterium]|nr:BolA/IbaG family iron-sulfur metabolism protein [Pseudomonadota bacterium]|tara:strand:+ start:237 stop:542 length:306 start_codon:yes stop_codon:yes gene_type:complete